MRSRLWEVRGGRGGGTGKQHLLEGYAEEALADGEEEHEGGGGEDAGDGERADEVVHPVGHGEGEPEEDGGAAPAPHRRRRAISGAAHSAAPVGWGWGAQPVASRALCEEPPVRTNTKRR